ncbi:hypothetical protein DEU56DRAFT_770284 [Suillus clintonianus]|uniref:uncharacterized protein n=1 Tax=Suillus clintonianus TaxID=1904413 RepID=UPI001B87F4C4|nr:uncharacterized protein DEU56DRAFT_770284 [Suillus clintonianus]KAG2154773.1 hypothetical protein DEU56DRAFT_770284 [Suillus clintonianus]
MRTLPLLCSFTCITSFFSAVRAFSVTVGTPTQCDDLSVSWTGGQAPFEILLTPVFEVPRNISVPASAFSNGKGSYSIPQLPFWNGTQFLLTMSDATAFGSGGTTPVLKVGNPVAKNNCNTTGASVDFTFDLPSSLQQCNGYTFDNYDNAVQPITITALIPGGESLIIHPPTGPSYSWPVDVSAGTTLVFVMTDSQGRQGGSSDLETVALSNNATCLSANSPSSTASVPSSTTVSTSSGISPTSSQSTSSTSNTATIAGTAIGCVVALAALVTLGMFLLRKRKASRSPYVMSSSKRHSRRLPSTDIDHEGSRYGHVPPIYPFPYQADSVSHLATQPASQLHLNNPSASNLAVSDPPTPFNQTQHSRHLSNPDSFAGYGDAGGSTSMSSAGRRKAAMAGQTAYKPTTRFIMHTDVDDVVPDDNGIVELPPQYSEHRQPLAPQTGAVPRPMSSHSDYSGPSDLAYADSSFVSPTSSHSRLPPHS